MSGAYNAPPPTSTDIRTYRTWKVSRSPAWALGTQKVLNPEVEQISAERLGVRVWTWCRLIVIGPIMIRVWRWEEQGMDEWPRPEIKKTVL